MHIGTVGRAYNALHTMWNRRNIGTAGCGFESLRAKKEDLANSFFEPTASLLLIHGVTTKSEEQLNFGDNS